MVMYIELGQKPEASPGVLTGGLEGTGKEEIR